MSEYREKIEQAIGSEQVVAFIKGTPEMVMCGNSARALEALSTVGAPITTVDILPDPEIRVELSLVSDWPTIPQVFIGGEFIGGADIVEEMAQSGELQEKLDQNLGGGWTNPGAVKVIELTDRPNPFNVVPGSQ